MDNLIDIKKDKPLWYKPVLCKNLYNKYAVCWRAMSDDGDEIYTISGTNVIFPSVTHWMTTPE